MNLHCIKCLMFTKNNNIKLKREIGGKVNIYSRCIGCGFKKFAAIIKEEIKYLLKMV